VKRQRKYRKGRWGGEAGRLWGGGTDNIVERIRAGVFSQKKNAASGRVHCDGRSWGAFRGDKTLRAGGGIKSS